jgi:RNA polymerase sigma-70 factor (ECF subfamily)
MIAETRRSSAFAPIAAEDSLLARLRAGEESCFEELVRATSPRLLATLRRMLHSEEDARDALQETFLAAFRALGTFQGKSALSTWLHRIAVNAALMKLRSRQRHPEDPIDDLLPRFHADGHRVLEAEGPAPTAEEVLDGEQRSAAVRRCIERLPESHRTVLLLRDIEELGTEETARALGISAEAVKMRLHRARQALRTLLVREGVLALASGSAERAGARAAAGSQAAPLGGCPRA